MKAGTIEHIGEKAGELRKSFKIEQRMSRKKLQAQERCLKGKESFYCR